MKLYFKVISLQKLIRGVFIKNFVKCFGNLNQDQRSKVPLLIIAFIAVIGLAFAACDLFPKDELDKTTWKTTATTTQPGVGTLTVNYTYTFDSPNVTYKQSYFVGSSEQVATMTGTYTIVFSDVTMEFDKPAKLTLKGKVFGNKLTVNNVDYTKQ